MRHYLLSITDDDDHTASTKLHVSDHHFALGNFRKSSTCNGIKRPKADRDDRLCHSCGRDVESSEHVLPVCSGVLEPVDARIVSQRKCEHDALILGSGRYPPPTPRQCWSP